MPTYCYRSETDKVVVVELSYPAGMAPDVVEEVPGFRFIRDRAAERPHISMSSRQHASKTWPMECIASGVNAGQADELRDHLSRHGVPTEVSRDGNPIYTSAKHREKALKVRGMHDKNSFN